MDNNVSKGVLKELRDGSNFDFMIAHMIGLDCAGHTFGSRHSEIQRKLKETEAFVAKIIEFMDDETTLVIFGDHGMTEDGNHGGDTLLEMRTGVFAY